jgi:hypothetical protein
MFWFCVCVCVCVYLYKPRVERQARMVLASGPLFNRDDRGPSAEPKSTSYSLNRVIHRIIRLQKNLVEGWLPSPPRGDVAEHCNQADQEVALLTMTGD